MLYNCALKPHSIKCILKANYKTSSFKTINCFFLGFIHLSL